MPADLPGWLQVAIATIALLLQLFPLPRRPRLTKRRRRFRLRWGKFELSRSDDTEDQH